MQPVMVLKAFSGDKNWVQELTNGGCKVHLLKQFNSGFLMDKLRYSKIKPISPSYQTGSVLLLWWTRSNCSAASFYHLMFQSTSSVSQEAVQRVSESTDRCHRIIRFYDFAKCTCWMNGGGGLSSCSSSCVTRCGFLSVPVKPTFSEWHLGPHRV